MSQTKTEVDPGSFRDREGRVFLRGGRVFRALSEAALGDWNSLSGAAFFQRAVQSGRIIETHEVPLETVDLPSPADHWVAAVEHKRIPFVSYPYEWTFGMLREAALLQLELLTEALDEGLILKDASAYNIQWFGCRPTLIDIPSFERWHPGEAWVGYQQFCQLFLYPLMLTAHRGVPFQPWLRGSIDGISPESCSRLLSARDRFRRGVLTHVVLHHRLLAATGKSEAGLRKELKATDLGKEIIVRNVRGLHKLVSGLRWKIDESEWSGYAECRSYSNEEIVAKKRFVEEAASSRRWNLVWDLGCNTGEFTHIVADHADYVVAMDGDALAVERLFQELRAQDNRAIHPLYVNLADPSPNLGWRGAERQSLPARGQPDLTLCLALIHHMVITANVPLEDFVSWLAGLGSHVVIEFVRRNDPMVQRLLKTKGDVPHDYSLENFVRSIRERFEIITQSDSSVGTRVLYFLRPRAGATETGSDR